MSIKMLLHCRRLHARTASMRGTSQNQARHRGVERGDGAREVQLTAELANELRFPDDAAAPAQCRLARLPSQASQMLTLREPFKER